MEAAPSINLDSAQNDRAADFQSRRPVMAEPPPPQSKLLNGVLGVMRVAVNTPVTARVGAPVLSYA